MEILTQNKEPQIMPIDRLNPFNQLGEAQGMTERVNALQRTVEEIALNENFPLDFRQRFLSVLEQTINEISEETNAIIPMINFMLT
jgi:hypothetical protein